MIRQSGIALADHLAYPGSPRAPGNLTLLGGGRLGRGRNLGDRLQDLRGDLVGVALRVRTAVLQVALVAVVHEGVRHADRSATVSQTIAELVPGRGLVLAGQALVVIRTVDGDVVHEVLLKGRHQLLKILLAAD